MPNRELDRFARLRLGRDHVTGFDIAVDESAVRGRTASAFRSRSPQASARVISIGPSRLTMAAASRPATCSDRSKAGRRCSPGRNRRTMFGCSSLQQEPGGAEESSSCVGVGTSLGTIVRIGPPPRRRGAAPGRAGPDLAGPAHGRWRNPAAAAAAFGSSACGLAGATALSLAGPGWTLRRIHRMARPDLVALCRSATSTRLPVDERAVVAPHVDEPAVRRVHLHHEMDAREITVFEGKLKMGVLASGPTNETCRCRSKPNSVPA